jgi:hypothetical protein
MFLPACGWFYECKPMGQEKPHMGSIISDCSHVINHIIEKNQKIPLPVLWGSAAE